MTTDQQSRKRALVDKLLGEYKPGAHGSSVDTDRIRSIVIADADLVAEIVFVYQSEIAVNSVS